MLLWPTANSSCCLYFHHNLHYNAWSCKFCKKFGCDWTGKDWTQLHLFMVLFGLEYFLDNTSRITFLETILNHIIQAPFFNTIRTSTIPLIWIACYCCCFRAVDKLLTTKNSIFDYFVLTGPDYWVCGAHDHSLMWRRWRLEWSSTELSQGSWAEAVAPASEKHTLPPAAQRRQKR